MMATKKSAMGKKTKTKIPKPPNYHGDTPLNAVRTKENDEAALAMAKKACGSKKKNEVRRQKYAKPRKTTAATAQEVDEQSAPTPHADADAAADSDLDFSWDEEETTPEEAHTDADSPTSEPEHKPEWGSLPLDTVFGDTEYKEKKEHYGGASSKKCWLPSWGQPAYPEDLDLQVKNLEAQSHIDRLSPIAEALAQDVVDIQTKSAISKANDGRVEKVSDQNRLIESFRLHDNVVVKITILDVQLGSSGKEGNFKHCQISKGFESRLDKAIGKPPSLAVEQWLVADTLLRKGGQIGGKSEDFWKTARDLARQRIFFDKDLQAKTVEHLAAKTPKDRAFRHMHAIVKASIRGWSFNPYHQAKRDAYALEHAMFHQIQDADIVMLMDNNMTMLGFFCSNAFERLLSTSLPDDISQCFETFSSLLPMPYPDQTRHGLHWVEWLKEHPEFDWRQPGQDPRQAKSGTYHFGARCMSGDPLATHGVDKTMISKFNGNYLPHVRGQYEKLRFGALGACTEVLAWFFELVDPELYARYKMAASAVKDKEKTRRNKAEIFTMRALLINNHTTEHVDSSDVHRGLAGLIAFGPFEGGDLLFRQFGLQIQCKPGCVQLFRGLEIKHSIAKWTGRRQVVVATSHQAVQQWALKKLDEKPLVNDDLKTNDCYDVQLAEVLPEEYDEEFWLDERNAIPERYLEMGSDDDRMNSPTDDEESEESEESESAVQQGEKRKSGEGVEVIEEMKEVVVAEPDAKRTKR